MDADFWHQRWEKNEIAFHEKKPNAFLRKYFNATMKDSNIVFVPLCGKTRDIEWLVSEGYKVVGVELSEIAIEQLLYTMKRTPEVTDMGPLRRYSSNNLNIFSGDIFNLSAEILGKVDCVYDRAALVAMPEKMRRAYTEHLVDITHGSDQFLVCFEYDQQKMKGPPFSISQEHLREYYSNNYEISLLEQTIVEGKLKRKVDAVEHAWWLKANL